MVVQFLGIGHGHASSYTIYIIGLIIRINSNFRDDKAEKIQKYMTSCEITCASGSYVIVVRYTFVKYVLKYTVGDSLFHMELFHNHHWSHNDGRSSRCYICFLQM